MNNGLMIDAVFALVLILGVVFGARRGLFRSFMALAAIVLALIGASLLTDALTEPVTDMLMPRLEKSVEEWFDTESQTPQGDVPQIEGETPAESDGGRWSCTTTPSAGMLPQLTATRRYTRY